MHVGIFIFSKKLILDLNQYEVHFRKINRFL